MRRTLLAACFSLLALIPPAQAQDKVLNLYSARHYQTDEALYQNFTKATGIRINRVDADDAGILARLKSEGASSPADVILLVDAARLWRAEVDGLFLPVRSATLEKAIPPQYRSKDSGEGSSWFGFSTRARLVVYDKSRVQRSDVDRYEKLALPVNKGRLCTRSGSHPYNLSLFGAMLEHLGPQATEAWLGGLVANMARAPKGGDTDQIKAVAAGECDVALSNTYYYARLLRSTKPEDQEVVAKTGIVWPDQGSFGTHVNVSGAGVLKHAPHREAAVKFLEYLASDEAQRYFAEGNNEWPAVASLKTGNPALAGLGAFKPDALNVAALGRNQPAAQKIYDRVGWK